MQLPCLALIQNTCLHGIHEDGKIQQETDLIRSFGDAATEDLYHGRPTARARRFPPSILPPALRKLDVLAAAHELSDLRSPPGNRLEALKGKWEGFYSIRINDQWRIVFRWQADDPSEVMITDYH